MMLRTITELSDRWADNGPEVPEPRALWRVAFRQQDRKLAVAYWLTASEFNLPVFEPECLQRLAPLELVSVEAVHSLTGDPEDSSFPYGIDQSTDPEDRWTLD